jgi:hypothetical protein
LSTSASASQGRRRLAVTKIVEEVLETLLHIQALQEAGGTFQESLLLERRSQMSTATRSRFFGSTAAVVCCLSQTVFAQDVPGQKLGKLRFCDSPYEIVVVTNDDTLWESRVKTHTCFELHASYTLDPSWPPRLAWIEGRMRYIMKVAVNVEGREHRVAVGFAIFDNDPLADKRPRA